MADKWLKRLEKFVALDTSNPPGKNYCEAIEMLTLWCKEVGFKTNKIPIPQAIANKRVNLLAEKRNKDKPRLLVYGHIDVVPADFDWQPFKPKIKQKKLYGRGVADMKGSLIAFLSAMDKIKNSNLPWDITLMITTDEETNQKKQIEYLLKKIDSFEKAVFLDLDSIYGYVGVGGLGMLQVKITVSGQSVHSGISHLGINALEKSVSILENLLKLKKRVEKRFSKIPVNPSLKIKTMQAKLNINLLRSGLKVNIVPDRCEIEIDRRLIPEETITKAKKEIIDCLKPLRKGVNFKVKFVHQMSGYASISKQAQRVAGLMKKIYGQGKLYGVMGSTDLLYFTKKHHWQFVALGIARDKESNIHGRFENIRLVDFEKLTRLLQKILS